MAKLRHKTLRRKIPISERRQTFVERVVEHGDATKAALEAGFSKRCAADTGRKLKMELRQQIAEQVQHRFSSLAPKALGVIEKLALGAESETVRYQCAKDLLDRAGHKPGERLELAESKTASKTTAELIEELRQGMGANITALVLKKHGVPIPEHIKAEVDKDTAKPAGGQPPAGDDSEEKAPSATAVN